LEFLAQGFGNIRHRTKIGDSTLVNPPKKLNSTETFLSEPFTKCDQAPEIKIK
jgi:hypothetical protein